MDVSIQELTGAIDSLAKLQEKTLIRLGKLEKSAKQSAAASKDLKEPQTPASILHDSRSLGYNYEEEYPGRRLHLSRYNISSWKDKALLGLGEHDIEFYITQFIEANTYQGALGGLQPK